MCFHGFGDRAALFLNIREALEANFKVYAFDLPFHGQTIWNEKTFTKEDFYALIESVLELENKTEFAIMGYSFGGRICPILLQKFPTQITNLYLVAPDGFKTKGLNGITWLPRPMRLWVKRRLENPNWFIKILRFFQRFGLINSSVFSFLISNLKQPKRRERLFAHWLSMDDFEMKTDIFEALLRKNKTPTHIFLGRNDPLVPLSKMAILGQKIPNLKIHVLEDGHKLVNSRLNDCLKSVL